MKCGLLGEKLSHSFSPQIHSMIDDYSYRLFEVEPDRLGEFLSSDAFDALNVTVPYKKAVIPYLAEMTPRAASIGSVNVITRRADGALVGDNQDYGGFKSLVKTSGISVKGVKALVLGSGGASETVCAVLRDMGAREVVVISRSGENNYENIHRHTDCGLIVNTTPVGMYPNNGKSPLSLKGFHSLRGVIDIIFNPLKTALVLEAEDAGVPAAGGLHMLVSQAVGSAQAFTGKKYDPSLCAKIERQLTGQTKNVVLIGMPGCGKTVIGRRLAAALKRPFIDLDGEIEKAAGKTIPQIFAEDGEEEFRRIETECCIEAGKKCGCVISTGGGVVTREQNRAPLRQNGTVVFLIRPLESLATANRPLLQTHSVQELANQRLPLYNAWADVKMLNTGINSTVENLIRFLHLIKAEGGHREA